MLSGPRMGNYQKSQVVSWTEKMKKGYDKSLAHFFAEKITVFMECLFTNNLKDRMNIFRMKNKVNVLKIIRG